MIALPQEKFTQGVSSGSAPLVGLEGLFNHFCSRQEGVGLLCFRKVFALARIYRFQTQ